MNLAAVYLRAFCVFLLLIELAIANNNAFPNLKTDPVLSAWSEAVPKDINLFTILVGDCSIHRQAINEAYQDWPQFEIDGRHKLYKTLSEHLQKTCKSGVCGAQTVLVTGAHETPVYDMREIVRAFANRKMCTTPDFGGLNVDCSRVWFAFSTCFADSMVNTVANELEGNEPSNQEIDMEARYQMRKVWPGLNVPHGMIRVIRSSLGESSNLDGLIRIVIEKESIRRTLTQAESERKKKKTKSEEKSMVIEGIDMSVLETSGFSGQTWALEAIQRSLEAVQKGLKFGNGPLVFFFLGPAGTGKTMLAKILARAYHGGEKLSILESRNDFRIFAMASFKSEEDVDSFVSPRAGLVGEGSIIDVFSSSKRPVIVLDEIEKAHSKLISSLLLSWFDEDGFVQDKKNAAKKFPTKDAVFILTSNCFAREISKSSKLHEGDARKVSDDVLKLLNDGASTNSKRDVQGCDAFEREDIMRRMKAGHAMADLSKFGFVVFLPPTPQQIDEIVSWYLEDYRGKHEARFGSLFWTDRALAHLKQRARSVAMEHHGSGGLSRVNSELSGELTRLMRAAMMNCRPDKQSQTLLYERNGELQARIVDCGNVDSSRQSSSQIEPPPSSSFHSRDSDSSTRDCAVEPAASRKGETTLDVEEYKDEQLEVLPEILKEAEEALQTANEGYVASFFSYVVDQLYLFAVTLLVMTAVYLALTYLPIFNFLPIWAIMVAAFFVWLYFRYPNVFWLLAAFAKYIFLALTTIYGVVGLWGMLALIIFSWFLPRNWIQRFAALT